MLMIMRAGPEMINTINCQKQISTILEMVPENVWHLWTDPSIWNAGHMVITLIFWIVQQQQQALMILPLIRWLPVLGMYTMSRKDIKILRFTVKTGSRD